MSLSVQHTVVTAMPRTDDTTKLLQVFRSEAKYGLGYAVDLNGMLTICDYGAMNRAELPYQKVHEIIAKVCRAVQSQVAQTAVSYQYAQLSEAPTQATVKLHLSQWSEVPKLMNLLLSFTPEIWVSLYQPHNGIFARYTTPIPGGWTWKTVEHRAIMFFLQRVIRYRQDHPEDTEERAVQRVFRSPEMQGPHAWLHPSNWKSRAGWDISQYLRRCLGLPDIDTQYKSRRSKVSYQQICSAHNVLGFGSSWAYPTGSQPAQIVLDQEDPAADETVMMSDE